MARVTRLNITLPLLELKERIAFEKLLPFEILPGGMRSLVVCVLENQESADYFVMACFALVMQGLENLSETKQLAYELILLDEQWHSVAECLLISFYDEYMLILRDLFCQASVELVRVVSYRSINGVCVEVRVE